MPYTVFVNGEFRIHVFKKNHETIWVGLTVTRTFGHKFSVKLAQALALLGKFPPFGKALLLTFSLSKS